jgi:hypothetical protein
MKKSVLFIVIVLLLSGVNLCQTTMRRISTKGITECKNCHTCDVPTRQNPCLIECPRNELVTIKHQPEEAPEVIIMNRIDDKYDPVIFSHKIHAQMSLMSGGCESCHHYNTSGPVLSCVSCHEKNRKREDLSKPDLKAAYHRQCMDCHREWSHSTGCNSCHTLKGTIHSNVKQSTEKMKWKDHPEIKTPDKLVYKTNYEKGILATFYHDEHVNKFGLNCINCHQQQNCSKCHDTNKNKFDASSISNKQTGLKQTFEEQHIACNKCHKNDNCTRCHSDKELKPFNHQTSTGWELKAYHLKLTCQKCHGNNYPFKKLDNNCLNCHKNWTSGSFAHKVTGFVLDEVHLEFECKDCHIDNDFNNKPQCTNCHDNYRFPEKKPGSYLKK